MTLVGRILNVVEDGNLLLVEVIHIVLVPIILVQVHCRTQVLNVALFGHPEKNSEFDYLNSNRKVFLLLNE